MANKVWIVTGYFIDQQRTTAEQTHGVFTSRKLAETWCTKYHNFYKGSLYKRQFRIHEFTLDDAETM